MGKVKLNFRKLSVTEKIARGRQIVDAMTGNASFPTPTPTLASVTAALDALEQANTDALEARALSKQRTAALEDKDAEVVDEVMRLASYVDSASGGKVEIILSAAMDVREPSIATNKAPDTPTNLTPTAGDQEGEIDLSWNASQNAQTYVVQMSLNPPTDTSWTQVAIVTTSKATVEKLTSGTKYWFRVAAIGAGGQSGWSDPATKMAP